MSRLDPSGRDLPLMQWGEALRRDRAARRRRYRALAATAAFVVLVLAPAIARPTPVLVWNATESAPRGLWMAIRITVPRRGDWVLARAPVGAVTLANDRGYLPRGVPLVKQVAAVAGSRICALRETISVDGEQLADRLDRDGKGRWLPRWHGCRVLRADEVFLLNADAPRSFDGRYFGVSNRSDILTGLHLLWRR